MNPRAQFLRALVKLSNLDRAVALLWYCSSDDANASMSAAQIAEEFEDAGYARQNISRLKKQLEADGRTAKTKDGRFRIRFNKRNTLDEELDQFLYVRPAKKSSSVLPFELFEKTRGYITKVVYQLNASYDAGLYDCCAVMCRRLAETLVIESFGALGKESLIQNSQNHFFMFSGLLDVIENVDDIGLSRNGKKGLKDFKRLGDLSAHNRRFNAVRNDIDRIRDGLRVASEELLGISGLK